MKIKHWLTAALSVAALGLAACGGEKQDAAQSASAQNNGAKVLRVATNAEFAPFEAMDEQGKIHGFDIDLIQAIAKESGFEVKIEHKPWDSLFAMLGNGDADILASAITITDERKQSMDFSDPYYKITQLILAPAGKTVASVDDLKNFKKIGVVNGQTGDLAASKILGQTSDKIARFENVTLLIKEVENGGVDLAISDSAVIAHYVKNNSNKGFTMLSIPDFETENYGFAVKKGNAELLNKLNEGLKKVQENGEYGKIEANYFAK